MKFLTNFPAPVLSPTQAGRVTPPLLLSLVLGAALLLRLAMPLWEALVPAPATSALAVATAEGQGTEPDLPMLQSLALFEASGPAAAASAQPPALNTALNLHLEGVMLSGDGNNDQAVILGGERRGSYRVGDALPVGANVTIAGIARDHVVIDNRGQREVLWLFAGKNAGAATAGVAAGNSIAGNPALALPAGTDVHVLNTAARLAEIISVAPAVENGQLIGYRLTPGARLKDFVQLGFRTNDVVTAANGIALDDMANLPKLYSLMDGATEVSFSLLRDGAPMTLKIALGPATPNNR